MFAGIPVRSEDFCEHGGDFTSAIYHLNEIIISLEAVDMQLIVIFYLLLIYIGNLYTITGWNANDNYYVEYEGSKTR
ncbi:hypothetical protein DZE46_002768 [Clostridium beijerinckii]|nr:hypothetical protein [Clostridium beijerinckii]NSA08017.1 hypothetical protein [Clostridium beijerinckii]